MIRLELGLGVRYSPVVRLLSATPCRCARVFVCMCEVTSWDSITINSTDRQTDRETDK